MANNIEPTSIQSDGVGDTTIRRPKLSRPHFLDEPGALAVGRFAADGRWLLASRGLCRMLGYPRRELLRKTVDEFTHPDDRIRQKELHKRMISGNTDSYTLEKRYICRSGLPLWVTETVSAVRDDRNAYLYSIAMVSVNERKRTEELFQLTLESSPNAIAIADDKGGIVLVNSETERIFWYQRRELLGKTMDFILPDVLHTEAPFGFGTLQIELMQGKWDSNGRRKDGTFFPVEVGVRAIETGQGTWTVTSIADLSESKQAEEQMLDMRIAS